MKPLISIIVPCYNVEKYIDRCMNSLVTQTLGINNIEIILVNDASTDGTYQKLLEWEKEYPESVMVITYGENIRQGGARNVGLQYASADYIGFVDSDDWIENDMYADLLELIERDHLDAVYGKLIRDYGNGQTVDSGEHGGIVTGLYRKNIIIDNNVWFPENISYEDNFWTSVLEIYLNNVKKVDKVLYHYFVNMNSTVTKRNDVRQLDRILIEKAIVQEYKKRNVFEQYKTKLAAEFIERFYLNSLYIFFTRFDRVPDVFNEMKKSVWEYFPDWKSYINVESYNERNRQLLRLLDIPRELSYEELIKIQFVYLKTFQLN
ncbi:MAG: glycosyltransferase family 2 protein [Lachnospiraceae bacterium]